MSSLIKPASDAGTPPPRVHERENRRLEVVPHFEDTFTCSLMSEEYAEETPAPDPEETANEEVKELGALGEWEEGRAGEPEQEAETVYDFPVTINRQVEFYLDFFQHKQKKTFAVWLSRSGRYLPMIRQELRKAGLPLDLAYLPLIESGYSVNAYSRARAAGLWQFIAATGRHYGLTINNYLDERREPVKSTRAAVAYLSALHEEFDSWHLVVAAYNAGEGKIRKAVKRYGTNNFWQLARKRYLHTETKRYVPKLIAAIIIAKDPEKYGFAGIDYEPPLKYETLEVPRWTSLQAVSVASGISLDRLRGLNRELRRAIVPPDYPLYPLKMPVGTAAMAANNLPRVRATASINYKTHIVKKGESLTRICKKYNLSKIVLLKANNLRSAALTPGQRLRIPCQVTEYRLLAENDPGLRSGSSRVASQNLVLHKVKPGETVWELARLYNVPAHMIAAWNDLADISRIRAGQQLALYLQDERLATARASAGSPSEGGKVLAAVAQKKPAPVPGSGKAVGEPRPGKKTATAAARITYHKVKSGDTLWDIARKYKLTPAKIRRWNKLDGDKIYPGRRLLLKLALDTDV